MRKRTDTTTSHPYTSEDIQKATGMSPSSFYAWKAKHGKKLTKGLNTPVATDPEKATRKRYSQEYMERVQALASDAAPTATTKRKYTKRKYTKRATAPTATATEYAVVKLSATQRTAFNTLAEQLGWEIKRGEFIIV